MQAEYTTGHSSEMHGADRDPFAPVPLAPWYRYEPEKIRDSCNSLVPVAKEERKFEPEPVKKPKRPLTAYNLFFHNERLRLIESMPSVGQKDKGKRKGGVGFADMARIISRRWREADDAVKAPFCLKANLEKLRYLREKDEYNQEVERRRRQAEEDQARAESAQNCGGINMSMAPFLHHQQPHEDARIAHLARELDKETKEMIIHFFG